MGLEPIITIKQNKKGLKMWIAFKEMNGLKARIENVEGKEEWEEVLMEAITTLSLLCFSLFFGMCWKTQGSIQPLDQHFPLKSSYLHHWVGNPPQSKCVYINWWTSTWLMVLPLSSWVGWQDSLLKFWENLDEFSWMVLNTQL